MRHQQFDQHKVDPFPTVYKSGCNTETDGECNVHTIYNPANKVFSTNTAVSSSTRLAGLNMIPLLKLHKDLKISGVQPWRTMQHTADYLVRHILPEHQKCVPHHRNEIRHCVSGKIIIILFLLFILFIAPNIIDVR